MTTDKIPRKRGRKLGSGRKEPSDRENDMRARYRSGETLEAISTLHGITRERVRQLLKKFFGMNGSDGGRMIQTFLKTSVKLETLLAKRENKEINKKRLWGLTADEFDAHVKHFGGCYDQKTPMGRYIIQRKNAVHHRGIQWNISFKDWWDIWQKSGKWELRGRGQGKYVMARYGDTDGYSVENVYICPSVENNSDRLGKKNPMPMGVRNIRGRFIATKMIRCKSHHIGTYDTPEEAHEAYLNFSPKPRGRRPNPMPTWTKDGLVFL